MKRLTKIGAFVFALLSSSPIWAASAISNPVENEPEQKLPALSLMSPLSTISLETLIAEAEAVYAAKNFPHAEKQFQAILDLDHDNRRVLFRLGNVFQMRGDTELAIRFYRRASKATEYSQGLDEFGEKALLNIALIATEQARLALAELEARTVPDTQKVQFRAITDELGMSDRRIQESIKRLQKVNSPNSPLLTEDYAKNNGQPQLIAGNVGREKVDLPEVTYLKPKQPLNTSVPTKTKAASRR
jgi:tetratricopeptide (TPR) repeat protein